MTKPFDATLNRMIQVRPDDWAVHFALLTGIPPGPSVPIDTDLATTLQADKIFRVDGPDPSLLHFEFQASSRLGIPPELMRYNVHAGHRNGLPVQTVLILLRPSAQASDISGVFRRFGVNGKLIHEFHYHVERVWQRPASFWLNAGISLAPLSLLTDEAAADFETAVRNFRNSLRNHDADEQTFRELWSSSYVLCGLRHDHGRVTETYRRLSMLLEDSTTYQAILEKGHSEGRSEGLFLGERKSLLLFGKTRFGEPSPAVLQQINAIQDVDRLDRLVVQAAKVSNWDDLLRTE